MTVTTPEAVRIRLPWLRARLARVRFHIQAVGKRRVMAAGRFLIWAMHGFPKSVTVHAGKELPMHRIPARSTKRDAKRAALANMRQAAGAPSMSWKRARREINAALRDHRAEQRRAAQEAAEQPDIAAIAAGIRGDSLAEQFKVGGDPTVVSNSVTTLPWWKRLFGRAA